MSWLLIAFAVVAGAFLPTQAGINAQLARKLGHPLLAASVSFLARNVRTVSVHLFVSYIMADIW